jgi:hypothetical protein
MRQRIVTVAARNLALLGLGVNTASPVPEQGNSNAGRIAFTTQYAVNVTGTHAPCCADTSCWTVATTIVAATFGPRSGGDSAEVLVGADRRLCRRAARAGESSATTAVRTPTMILRGICPLSAESLLGRRPSLTVTGLLGGVLEID